MICEFMKANSIALQKMKTETTNETQFLIYPILGIYPKDVARTSHNFISRILFVVIIVVKT